MSEHTAAPGLIIAAPRSGAGKTTVTLGLLRALARRGLAVQPFKCGPDYIDPAFHTAATGRPSFNLDSWAMDAGSIRGLVDRATAGSDMAVVEGVMGLFDGVATPGRSGRGGTADIAAHTGWPVVLVLDVSGQAETAAAVALGLMRYRDDVRVGGVILNTVASLRHRALIEPAFQALGLPVVGVLMRNAALALPERHLGLVQAGETGALAERLERLADAAEASFDLDAIRALARPAGPCHAAGVTAGGGLLPPGQRIAVAQDLAFSFLYPHLVEAWRAAGASVSAFSPLADEAPDAAADAIWLPGGYPELHAGRLAAAGRFKAGLAAAAAKGTAIHGECGGYMTLGTVLVDADGVAHAMAGLLDVETSFAARKLHLGYRRALLTSDCVLGPSGSEIRGHEFHYATLVRSGDAPLVTCFDANGEAVAEQGARRGSVSGTFFHVIAGGAP